MTSNKEIQTKPQVIKHLQGYSKTNIEVWDLNKGNKKDFIKDLERKLASKNLSVIILETD
jgi:hypothetical protein